MARPTTYHRAVDPIGDPAARRLAEAVAEIRAEQRLDFRAAERVIARLSAPGATLPDLVRYAAVARRDVEAILRRLAPWLDRDGDHSHSHSDSSSRDRDSDTNRSDRYVLTASAPELPARPAQERQALTEAMTEISARLPPPVWSLDHISATPDTMAARAAYLSTEYALAGTTVLCVGDHDLTSIAVTLAEPEIRVLVVDVDQRLLAVLDEVTAERDLPITTAFADLRIGLPESFLGRADLAFTDPPYTPEAIGLFLTRALQGLARTGHERVAVAHGFAGHQLTCGFRTQSGAA